MGDAGFQGIQWKKLAPPGDLFSINFDEDGPSIGPVRLLKRTESGWTPRSAQELDFIFDRTLERETDFTGKMRGLNAVARALNKGDLAHAMLVTLFTDLPPLNDEVALHCAMAADTLAKAGFNPDQDRDEHGRWTSEGSDNSPTQSVKEPHLAPGFEEASAVCTDCHVTTPAIPPVWEGPFHDFIFGPHPVAPNTQNSDGFKDALAECHNICVQQFVDGTLPGVRGLGGVNSPTNIRRCIRQCLQEKGYENY